VTKRIKKISAISVLVIMLLALGAGGGYALAAGGMGPFHIEIGPVEIVEPIQTTLAPDSPPLPAPGTKLEPGDSFTIREQISNLSSKRGYWVYPANLSWSNEGGVMLYIEITTSYMGAIVNGPLYIEAGTTKVVSITVRIKENSPTTTGVTFYLDPPTRMEPERG